MRNRLVSFRSEYDTCSMFFLCLILILTGVQSSDGSEAGENSSLVMDPYDLASTREYQSGEVPSPSDKEAKAWLGNVVLRILKLSHYKSDSIFNVEKKVVDHYVRSLDPDGFVFSETDVDFFTQQWRGKIEADIEGGEFLLAKEVTSEGGRRFEELLGVWDGLTESGGLLAVPRLEIFDVDVRRGTPQALLRNFFKGKFSRGWDEDDFKSALVDRGNKIRNMTESQRVDGFLDAVAKAFDRNSAYYPEERHQYVVSKVALQPTGVGIDLKKDGSGEIDQVFKNSPAERSGAVLEGDKVLSITDDVGINHPASTSVDQFSELLASEVGKSVTVEVKKNDATISHVTLQSEKLEIPAEKQVSSCIIDHGKMRIGVLRIPSFYASKTVKGGAEGRMAGEDTREEIINMKKGGVDSIVIDLRQDSGGSVEAAEALTSLFLEGVVYHSMDRNGVVQTFGTKSKPIYTGPLVVLVSAGTASAAEIFAKAVQDHGRGLVVGGRRTFGKGSLQNLLDLDWHGGGIYFPEQGAGSVRVTTRILFGPRGGGIQGFGVIPDIVLPCSFDIALAVSEREGRREEVLQPAALSNIKSASPDTLMEWNCVVEKSQKRVEHSPYFNKIKDLTSDFDPLLREGIVEGGREGYAKKMEPFDQLSSALREISTSRGKDGACGELDPVLSEAVKIAEDLVDCGHSNE